MYLYICMQAGGPSLPSWKSKVLRDCKKYMGQAHEGTAVRAKHTASNDMDSASTLLYLSSLMSSTALQIHAE